MAAFNGVLLNKVITKASSSQMDIRLKKRSISRISRYSGKVPRGISSKNFDKTPNPVPMKKIQRIDSGSLSVNFLECV